MEKTRIFAYVLTFLTLSSAASDSGTLHTKSLLPILRTSAYTTAAGTVDSLKMIETNTATVFIFFSSECPISNSYMPVITKMSKDFADKNIKFFGVIADPDVTAEKAKKFGVEYEFPCDILMDSKQQLALLLGAHITPEVVVLSPQAKILYQGRIDDRYIGLGKGRQHAKVHDLVDALSSIADGKKVQHPKTQVIGCWIPGVPQK